MEKLYSTREIAEYLGINEKMVYSLVSEKGLPASKVTGKWLFPLHLVQQWVENHTINFPESSPQLPPYDGLLVITGSNDLLLEKTISLFNKQFSEQVAVFGNLGSMGGLRALRRNLCHMATSHLLHADEQDSEDEYNFDFAGHELDKMPVVVNFCRREQGLLLKKNNPKQIRTIKDIGTPGVRVANRATGTGTRLLFDRELTQAGIKPETLDGYHNEVNSHMDIGLEVLTGKTDLGPGIRPVASLLDLDFIPLRWERYDLLVTKDRFFDKGIQFFLGLLQDDKFKQIANKFDGYDVSDSGKMVFPREAPA